MALASSTQIVKETFQQQTDQRVQQVEEENHLRWDSLGEFLALAVSLEDIGTKNGNQRAKILAKTLDSATGKLLESGKSPSRKAGELDNRGSHYYLGKFWAEALVEQTEDTELAAQFKPMANALAENEETIVAELAAVQCSPANLDGYYHATLDLVEQVMRPSDTLNSIIS